ncbi:TonB family protein [Cyclobacterium qasimii]|nr:TonB family protein [Cyclobacterium qasimii]EPR66099.1 hypothetical protein ADICYQ_4797 [Cyclobacterium qasimii M12-11B]
MVRALIIIFLFGVSFFSASSQTLKKVKEKSKNSNTVFTFHVLDDEQTKEGAAEIKYKGNMGFRVKGQYSQGNKSGTWDYFDSDNTLIQQYNFSTKSFEYLQDFKSVKAVYILKDEDLVEVKTGAMPVLLGGDAKFFYFLANNVRYPHAARAKGVTGTIGVMVTITKEGKMERPFIPKAGDKSLDAEALRVVSLMPNDWIPLYLDGKATDSLVLLYFNFHMG